MTPFLACVSNNQYVSSDQVIAILDHSSNSVKKLIKSALEEKPRSVINLSGKKAAASVLVLTGDRYIILALTPNVLSKRFESG
jgi:regulator of extracellular matrix RemA (YlzA/DUF370 family)